MVVEQATAVRKDWSNICDSVVREKPHFIRRTHDEMVLASYATMLMMLKDYKFTAERFNEKDGSVSLSLQQIDLVVNGTTIETARHRMGEAILEYAEEYYENFSDYSKASNRKGHLPYVMKALLIGEVGKIGEELICA